MTRKTTKAEPSNSYLDYLRSGERVERGGGRPFAPLTTRLTHRLVFNKGIWACACGYVLGKGGHKALYAQCRVNKDRGYLEFKISSATNEKRKRNKGMAAQNIRAPKSDLFG